MKIFEKKEWASILKKAMGKDSQTKFAKQAGVSRVSLNYYLNEKSSSQPSYDYAIKISNASEFVSTNEVLIAAGYDPLKEELNIERGNQEEALLKDIMHLLLKEGEISYGEELSEEKRLEVVNLLKKSIEIKKI